MYETGKTEDNPDATGLAFRIHPKNKDCVTDLKIYFNRVIKMEVNLHGKDSVTEINAYDQHVVLRMKKWNNFMMILKEQWLIVTQNI